MQVVDHRSRLEGLSLVLAFLAHYCSFDLLFFVEFLAVPIISDTFWPTLHKFRAELVFSCWIVLQLATFMFRFAGVKSFCATV